MIEKIMKPVVPPIEQGRALSRSGDDFRAILEKQRAILDSRHLSPKALLEYQVAVSAFSSRVEVVSRVAECVVATVRRLQNGL